MARDSQRLLGVVNSPELGLQIVLLLELLIEPIRQQRLVYPPTHEADVSGSQGQFEKIPTEIARSNRGVTRATTRSSAEQASCARRPQWTTRSRITEYCGGFETTLA